MDSSMQNKTMRSEEVEARYLLFRLDGQMFGLPIASVMQIIQMQDILRVPQSPVYEKGVIHLRGSIIPVTDARLRLGKSEAPYTDRTCILVCSILGKTVGLIVDDVEEVAQIDGADIAPPPDMEALSSAYLLGVAKTGAGMVLLLNAERLWQRSV